MSGQRGAAGKVAGDWDTYWRNQRLATHCAPGGAHDDVLRRFWSRLFDEVFSRASAAVNVLDIGCGNGAVARLALASARSRNPNAELGIFGLDHSYAALAELHRRAPRIVCIAADGAHGPFRDQAFDLITSQFGLEYAGPLALDEAVRLLRPGGILSAALHVRNGGIYRECEINRRAVDLVRGYRLLDHFRQAFEASLGAKQRRPEDGSLRAAESRFTAALAKTEDVLRRWGKDAATGLIFRLYTDVATMARQRETYEPRDIFAWVEFMTRELDNYSSRMASMLAAALSAEQFDHAVARLQERGLGIRLRSLLGVGPQSVPVAWIVVAVKTASSPL
ncbi:MAG: class I SAM-dependent methyltransferase [Sinobacteraceae bacterium]|nr:class I SAM-dependent methyltransferase [Nevskiaceae bacterium]